MEIIVHLIIGCVAGAITAAIAASKGRNSAGWFFGGFFLGIIGIIIVAVLPNLKEQDRYRSQSMAERRRLREQLRQEKMKSEAFRQHAAHRLDAHDDALGLDTRTSPALGGGTQRPALQSSAPIGRTIPRASTSTPTPGAHAVSPANPPVGSAAPPAQPGESSWYYESGGASKGPVPQSTLVWMLESGAVSARTLVWTDGQGEWKAASAIPAFRDVAKS